MNDSFDHDLDAWLRAAFVPPPAQHFAATARAAVAPLARAHRLRPWPWLLAAAALLVTIALGVSRPRRGPEGHSGAELGTLWARAYELAIGPASAACCDHGADFGRACETRFAQRLTFASGGSATVRGCYCGGPTGGCVAALLEDGARTICVFVLPRSRDPAPQLPAGSPLVLSRRELGPLVLYAAAPVPVPAVLAGFELPAP